MRRFAGLLLLATLGGCAGYAADHARPRTSLIAPQLARFNLSADQSRCMTDQLTASLTVPQLRYLSDTAAAAAPAAGHSLAPHDLVTVSAHTRDARIQPLVRAAAEACALRGGTVVNTITIAAAPSADAPAAPIAAAPPQPPAPPSVWVNLGSAASGQAIAVEAGSVRQEGAVRTAWFRLTNPGQSAISAPAYRLRIDCAARTINPMAMRRHGPDGGLIAERDHGPAGEGALPVEAGTVMELAYLALCT